MSTRWLPDVNVWLALAIPAHYHHDIVNEWFHKDDHPIYFCRASQQGVLRLLTTAAVLAPYRLSPFSNRQAQDRMKDMVGHVRISIADEPHGLEPDWERFADTNQASPKLWMDAYLAAFARCGGFRLVTNDKAFKQFKSVDVLVLG